MLIIANLVVHRDVRTAVLFLGKNLEDIIDAMSTSAQYQELLKDQKLFHKSSQKMRRVRLLTKMY